MVTWGNKRDSALEREKASQRLDCFLSVLYLYPNCLEEKDMSLLSQRETELTKIYSYTGKGFFTMYALGVFFNFAVRKGSTPYFKDIIQHGILATGGAFASSYMTEKIAAEMHYNQVMIQLADKYNFTPEEVMDLQRNLNQYYIQRDREADLKQQ